MEKKGFAVKWCPHKEDVMHFKVLPVFPAQVRKLGVGLINLDTSVV